MIFLEKKKKATKKVFEKIFEVSSKVGIIQEFCEGVEEIHKITKCQNPDCPIESYATELRKVVFDPMVDYDVPRNFFITLLNKPPEAFWSIYSKKVKKT